MKRQIALVLLILIAGTTRAQKSPDTISLFFKNNVSAPSTNHFKIIDSLSQLKDIGVFNVDIIGYTNNIGSHTYNLQLSKKRAESIAEIFQYRNVRNISWQGELSSSSSKNRRVDLIIYHEEIIEVQEIFKETLEKNIKETEVISTLKVSEVKVGEKKILKNILFKGGRDIFLDSSYPALWDLYNDLNANPSVIFKLQGHICCSPEKDPKEDGVNTRTGKRNLSVARAYQVYWFLKERGIDEARMSFEGFAHQFPQGLENEALDRRVEIEIISK